MNHLEHFGISRNLLDTNAHVGAKAGQSRAQQKQSRAYIGLQQNLEKRVVIRNIVTRALHKDEGV